MSLQTDGNKVGAPTHRTKNQASIISGSFVKNVVEHTIIILTEIICTAITLIMTCAAQLNANKN